MSDWAQSQPPPPGYSSGSGYPAHLSYPGQPPPPGTVLTVEVVGNAADGPSNEKSATEESPHPHAPPAYGDAPGSPDYPGTPGNPLPVITYAQGGTAPPYHPSGLWYLGTRLLDPTTPAPLGTIKVPGYDPEPDFELLQAARGQAKVDLYDQYKRQDENTVAVPIVKLTLQQRDALNDYFVAKTGADIPTHMDRVVQTLAMKDIIKALIWGPLLFDAYLLKKCLSRLWRDEMILAEVILNRDHDDLRLLTQAFKQQHNKELIEAVKNSLSNKIQRVLVMALNCQRTPDNVPVDQTQVLADVETLANACKKRQDLPFFEIFINRSRPHLTAVITAYDQSQPKTLSKAVKRACSGDAKNALLYILHGLKPKRGVEQASIWRDAKLIEKTMAGLGTNESRLVYRIIRAHWDPSRMAAIKEVYETKYGKTIEHRISKETLPDHYSKTLYEILKLSELDRKEKV
ncbi:annexin A4 [Coprinopsis cinerea AmutBmut pab1-1]|nr:annexin A4 [Coprinopsis cinerea AmutBmut pab1-1]